MVRRQLDRRLAHGTGKKVELLLRDGHGLLLDCCCQVVLALYQSGRGWANEALPCWWLVGAKDGESSRNQAPSVTGAGGIMRIITPFADAASQIYANSGYLPAKDYWRPGAIFASYHRRALRITPYGEITLSQPVFTWRSYAEWKMTATRIKFSCVGFLESDRMAWPQRLAVWRKEALWLMSANSMARLTGELRDPLLTSWAPRPR